MQSIEEVRQAMQQVEAQRSLLGNASTEAALEALQDKLKKLQGEFQAPERKQVTILFAEIFGVNAISELLDHEDVMELMNRLWERIDQAILQFGGTIDKHLSDSIMAIFGIPTAQEDDPERAISAALAMKEAIKTFLQDFPPPVPDLQIHIGLHTGLVSLGKVGIKGEYTAMGDAVNVASRIGNAAPNGDIFISHQLFSHVIGVFNMQKLEPIRVKGKSNPISIYRVIRKKKRAFRVFSSQVEGVETPTVGREQELQQLQAAFEAIHSKKKLQLVNIVGEAGVGKSRLLHEFSQWWELNPTEFWLWKGRATQNEQNSAYFLMRMLFDIRFEIQDFATPGKAEEKLVQGIVRYMGMAGEKCAHFIGHLLGYDFSSSPYLKGILNEPKQIQQQAFLQSIQLFKAMAQRYSLVLCLEDLHWADQGSLQWLSYLLHQCDSFPILMLLTCRPIFLEKHTVWNKGHSRYQRIFLESLTQKDALQLTEAILHKVSEASPEFLNLIVEKANGNPFCIEELIKMLVAEGVILKTNEEKWHLNLKQLDQLKVPSTLTGVLQARFDSLKPQEKEVMHSASVIGRVFWDQAIQVLVEDEHMDIEPVLEALKSKGMLFQRKQSLVAGCREYIFKHSLLQEVVYESVLQGKRRLYHHRIATWMQEKDGIAEVIARHYELAGKAEQASTCYIQAAQKAKESNSLVEAILLFERSLSLLSESEDHATQQMLCHSELGEIMDWQAQYELAKHHFQELLQIAKANNDALWQAKALNLFSLVHRNNENASLSLEDAEQAQQVLEKANLTRDGEYANSLRRQAIAISRLGKTPESTFPLLRKALEIYIGLDDELGEANIYLTMGIMHDSLGEWEQAESSYFQALHIYQLRDNQERIGTLFINLGEINRKLGQAAVALNFYQQSLEIAQNNDIENRILLCTNNMAGAHLELEEFELAEEKALQVIDMVPDRWFILSETYNFLAQGYLGQGKIEKSFASAQKALSLAQENHNVEMLGSAWGTLGQVAMQASRPLEMEGQSLDASSCFAKGFQIFQDAELKPDLAKVLRLWAIHEWQAGNPDEAHTKWMEAKHLFAELKMPLFLEKMRIWPPQNASVPRS